MRACGVSVLSCLLFANHAAAESRPKVAVLDVQTTGIEAEVVAVLSEILSAEVHALGTHEVVSGRDLQAMIGFEKQRDLVGCVDASCLADIGGALGVDHLVAGQVGKLGQTYVVNIKLIDIRSTRVENRVYETVAGEIDTVIATIRTAVHKLFGNRLALPSAAAGGDGTPPNQPAAPGSADRAAPTPPATKPAEPPAAPTPATAAAPPVTPVPGVEEVAEGRGVGAAPLVLLGIGGASAVVGIVFEVKARTHHANATNPQFVGAQLEIGSGRSSELIGHLTLGLAAASLVAGTLVWLLSAEESSSSGITIEPFIAGDATGLSLVGRL